MELFNFKGHEIRFINDKPVANDVATTLGYSDPSKTISTKVKPKYKTLAKLVTVDGKLRDIMVLEEGGIYQLVLGSKLESADEFQDWLFEEVLPSIRKTGSYSIQKPKTALELAKENLGLVQQQIQLLEDLERKEAFIKQQQFLLEEQQPKVDFFDAFREAETNITFNDYAKILSNKLNNKFPAMGDGTLCQILRDNRFLMSHSKEKHIWNNPYQRYVKQGVFVVIEKQYKSKTTLYNQTLITPKGQQYLFKWFTEKYIPKVVDIADYQNQPKEEEKGIISQMLENAAQWNAEQGNI